MLLNTWLTVAKRRLFSSPQASRTSGRRTLASRRQTAASEQLEERTLLTALVIDNSNLDAFTNPSGAVEITNANLGANDSIVIQSADLSSGGGAVSINLSGISLQSIAIESTNVSAFDGTAIDISLTNVTGLNTIAIEDVSIADPATGVDGLGVNIFLDNTDVNGLTLDDSQLPGVVIDATNGSDILHGVITQNTIVADAGFEGVLLMADGTSTADNFQIVNNFQIDALDRDAIQVRLTDSPLDGLVIADNVIGTEPGADVLFRAEGDTFFQPFRLTNNANDGERITQLELDLTPLGLVFDTDGITGKPFTALNGTGAATGLVSTSLDSTGQILTVVFDGAGFTPGETLEFVIDVDLAPDTVGGAPIGATILGNDLIGAQVQVDFTAGLTPGSVPKQVSGAMVGDTEVFSAAQFAVGAGAAGNTHGINLALSNSPLTNATIVRNAVTGVAGHGLIFDAAAHSDVTGVVEGNTIVSSGRDGIHFDLVDSNFTGAVIGNVVANNSGHGVNVQPTVTRTGLVEDAFDTSPVIITSTNHGLQTGDEIIIQGMVNDDPTVNHPGNGRHTITRINNNQFSLQGVSGLPANVVYVGGGAWYVPDIQMDGSARGLVTVDMQATVPRGSIQDLTSPGAVTITSPNHGLTTGQRIRIKGAAGVQGVNGVQKITVVDADTFTLDSVVATGTYDKSQGLATWNANVITAASNTSDIVITSPGHGLESGDEIRVSGVEGNTAANGTFFITRIDADTFLLRNSAGNGAYTANGRWVALNDSTFTGDDLPQRIGRNSITNNGLSGVYVDLTTGTVFNGDIVGNDISQNGSKGIHIESHSFGLGTDLPVDPNDPFALPGLQDISFNVNIGSDSANPAAVSDPSNDRNLLDANQEVGILIEALDFGTGSFFITGNRITDTVDSAATTAADGHGIRINLESDLLPSEAVSFLAESVITDNVVGVDNQGNDGHGLAFNLTERTRIQDLKLTKNRFVNNNQDGFNFFRSEDGDLNSVIFESNVVTNNGGDGFDLFAENTVKDRLDFVVNSNSIRNNGQYGMRIDVQADARIEVEFDGNEVLQNGATANGAGFHPNDGVAGSTNAAGGVGIHAFQQVEVVFHADGSRFDQNFGDGFSIDAFHFFDTLTVQSSFTDSTFNSNTLTGFRNHGAAYGTIDLTRSEFNLNGEDGFRSVAIEDKSDFFNRRVGGQDIDVIGLGNQFIGNGESGAVLGMGVSAVFGNGSVTTDFSNQFTGNSEDGLKIVQEAGPYLRSELRQRVIETDANFFTGNGGEGIDIGHHVAAEGGNTEHGEEVISDVQVTIANAVVSGNDGDGIEYLADDVFRIGPVVGGGQDLLPNLNISSLTVVDSRVVSNGRRGIDILNRVNEDSRITLVNNEILSNEYSGVYVMNTAAHNQIQQHPDDPFDIRLGGVEPSGNLTANIELRVQDNLIESNGTAGASSRVLINDSLTANDNNATPHPDWAPVSNLIDGTLGGLVLRVGNVDSVGRLVVANAELELGQSGIDAEVWRNSFDGNFGADVYFDSFVSHIPPLTADNFNEGHNPFFRWNQGYRDPLSRLDLVFRENTGPSLDVVNGFAFLDHNEDYFKRRNVNASTAPNHAHALNPNGAFVNSDLYRNLTRTIGYQNTMGDVPTFHPTVLDDGTPSMNWSYDGWGTSTWRVESDFDFNNFSQTSPISGFSDFYDVTNLGTANLAELSFQWDTGQNVPGFTGLTPYSLQRGDVFNVLSGEAPIAADSFEQNDSFVGAADLGIVAGAGFSVNALADGGNLNIEKKGDRDYYSFVAGDTGLLDVLLGVTDLLGDNIQYTIYEVDPDGFSEEVPMIQAANGAPLRTNVNPGGNGTLTVNVTSGTTYIIEVLSDEAANLGLALGGKPFVYGTTRSYTLTINAPGVAPPPVVAAPAADSSSSSSSASGGGGTAAISIEDQDPFIQDIVDVSPDPRNTAVESITVLFSEDVTGVDISDFTLTRNGVGLNLSGALVTEITPSEYLIENLGSLTGLAGSYTLTLNATGSGIADTDESLLAAGGSESWTTTNTISSFADTVDANPGDGLYQDRNGNTTLRAAIMEANATAGFDVIRLGTGTYTLSIAGEFEDGAATGDLDITESLRIIGNGAGSTIIDAAQLDRVFHVFPGVNLILENLTVQGGEAFDGGGIFVEGHTVDDTGAQVSAGGMLRLLNVNVINNEAFNQGGGIYNLGTMDIDRSSISMNDAGSRGGGIFNHGVADIRNVTVSGNSAVSRGGGIYTEGTADTVNTQQNAAVNVSQLTSINSTIANNYAGASGGGLFVESGATATLGNTIIDLNTTDHVRPDMVGRLVSLGNNLIGNLAGSRNDSTLISSDLAGGTTVNPGVITAGLGGLTNAGTNATWHHPLLSGASLAVDAGNNSLFQPASGNTLFDELDQIGNPRLIEGNDDAVFVIDIGATEFLVSQPVATFTATPNPVGTGETITFDGTASTHTNPGAGFITTYEWDFDYAGTPASFTVDATGATTSTVYPTTGNRQVALRVTDNTANTDIFVVTVIVGQPLKPIINSPFPVTSDLTPTISWSNGTGTFSLVIDNLTTGQTGIIDVTGLTANTYTVPANLTPGQYSAVVTATNLDGSTSSDPYVFEVVRIDISNPTEDSSIFDITPKFEWTPIPDTERYELWVSQTSPVVQGRIVHEQFIDADQALIAGGGTVAAFESPTQLPVGTYTAWVRAFDDNGNAGDWSAARHFSIARVAVTGPAPVTRHTLDRTPTISWTDLGANQYELWVTQVNGKTDDGNGGLTDLTSPQRVIYLATTPGTSFTPTTDLNDGLYRVWVRPVADDGETGLWSFAYNFTIDYLNGPTLISPLSQTGTVTVTDRTPEFVWNAIDGAARYEIWVNNLTTGTARVIHRTDVPHVDGVTEITYTDPVVLRNGTYRWWVRAFNSDGEATAWSTGYNFFIPAPRITAPTGTVTTTRLPTFTWTGVPEYVRYELWVNNLDTNQSRVIHRTDLTTTSFTPTLPLENGNFRVWVRGFDAEGNDSQWSNPVNFTINTAATGTAPRGLTPTGFITDNTPTFTWTTVANATSYEIIVKNLTPFDQPVVINEVGITTNTYTPTSNLSPGSYRWWVRGLNADGDPLTGFSQPLYFQLVSAEQPAAENDQVLVTSLTLPVHEWADDLRSITVHPAAVVASVHQADEQTVQQPEAEPAATEIASDHVDSVMEAWAAEGWWVEHDTATEAKSATDAVTDSLQPEVAVSTDSNQSDARRNQFAAAAALLGLGLTTKRKRSRKDSSTDQA